MHPTHEELHDLNAGRMTSRRIDRTAMIWLLVSIWIGGLLAIVILALGDVGARADRPTACMGLSTAAECGARMAEVKR